MKEKLLKILEKFIDNSESEAETNFYLDLYIKVQTNQIDKINLDYKSIKEWRIDENQELLDEFDQDEKLVLITLVDLRFWYCYHTIDKMINLIKQEENKEKVNN